MSLNCLRGERDGFESRSANFVYSHGTYLRRKSAEDCRLSRRVLTEPSGDHVPHDAFVYLLRIKLGALHGLAHDHRAQLWRAHIREASLEFSHRRTTSGDDDNLVQSSH